MLNGTFPSARLWASSAFDPTTGSVVLFGGCGTVVCPLAETWIYAHGSWTNLTSSLSIAPSARYGAVMTFDPVTDSVVLFGGSTGHNLLADTWVFQHGSWSPVAPATGAPPARVHAGFATDRFSGQLLLFGGTGSGGRTLADSWIYSNGVWRNITWQLPIAPSARAYATMADDYFDGYIVLFGGRGACGNPCGDTWSFANGHWTNLTADLVLSPSARYGSAAAYDQLHSGLILVGGRTTTALGDTWEFKNGAWTNLSRNLWQNLPPRFGATVTFDQQDGYLIVTTGHSAAINQPSTWAFLAPLSIRLIPLAPSTLVGATVTFSATVAGGYGPYRTSINFGDGSIASADATTTHVYAQPGWYRITATVTDGRNASTHVGQGILVTAGPLAATLNATASLIPLGRAVLLTAVPSGGVPPYSFWWSGVPSGCAVPSGPVLVCTPRALGTYPITITVEDSHGAVVHAVDTIHVGLETAVSSNPSSPLTPSSGIGSFNNWLVPSLAVATGLCGLAAMMSLRTARQAARRPPVTRMICYIPPEWSETPDDLFFRSR